MHAFHGQLSLLEINRNEDKTILPTGHNSADTRGMMMFIDQRSRTNQILEQPDTFHIGNETHLLHGDRAIYAC